MEAERERARDRERDGERNRERDRETERERERERERPIHRHAHILHTHFAFEHCERTNSPTCAINTTEIYLCNVKQCGKRVRLHEAFALFSVVSEIVQKF